ncbi:LysR family transcriptional regulator [Lysinibacter sp. HNR]|uniref:LysR family transcriptional regulator n=1 Tax=Lysinibacter sp. HNR TaxID=3031408 RepID=UPI0024358B18|nr:LysR family transcriptional regulator [Lysinibacter sp. HNR]WGD38292.1 LysR family transcriptional regulator [Lysinibacter sp. HNR]
MKMLPTALIYFTEVAKSGSVTDAAQKLHVSPSAISRQVSKLESAVGVPLFARHPRGMSLTRAGRLLLMHARRSESEGDAVVEELRNLELRKTRVIRVASAEGLAGTRVTEAIARMSAEYNEVVFKLEALPSAEATRQVINGGADVAVVFALGPQRDVIVELSVPAPPYAVVSPDHVLASHKSITLRELCEHRLALADHGLTQRELFDVAVLSEKLTPNIVFEAGQLGPVLTFARSGAGITLATRLAVTSQVSEGLVLIPVENSILMQREAQIQTMPGRVKTALVTSIIAELAESLRTF